MICVTIKAVNMADVLNKMKKASAYANILEVRLDLMDEFDIEAVVRRSPRPVLITYRSRKEGGQGLLPYPIRFELIGRAIEAGAHFVDLEYTMPAHLRQRIIEKKASTRIIVSKHFIGNTPQENELVMWLDKLITTGCDVVKLVTMAKTMEDNLKILSLIPNARCRGSEIIAFCMGNLGRISRIMAVPFGAFMTFASLGHGEETAEGQIPGPEMKKILEGIRKWK